MIKKPVNSFVMKLIFSPFYFVVNLIGINVGNTGTRTSRFVNYLRNLLPSTDTGVMELAAFAIGRLALVSGAYTAEYVEFEAKRAFEWLCGDRHEAKRHGAVSIDEFVLMKRLFSNVNNKMNILSDIDN